MAVHFQQRGNPHYPLPPDYLSLTPDGQRMARVNAVCLDESPQAFMAGWLWMCDYYLGEESGFFHERAEFADFHLEWTRDLVRHPFNVIAGPRGFGKSTWETTIKLKLALSADGGCLYLTSKQKLARRSLGRVRRQLLKNPRILEDFGYLRPKRGEGAWEGLMMDLTNGFQLEGEGVEAALRGMRQKWIILDDPEKDPDNPDDPSAWARLSEQTEETFMKVILPMLAPGYRMVYLGTILDAKSFLWKIISGAKTNRDGVPLRNLPGWNVRHDGAEDREGRSRWPARFPTAYLKQMRDTLSPSQYGAEYLALPGSDQDCPLTIDEEKTEYVIAQGEWADAYQHPLQSRATIRYHQSVASADFTRKYVPREQPFNELVLSTQRLITVDAAFKAGEKSDNNVGAVLGLGTDNTLWVFDLWSGKGIFPEVARQVIELAVKWRAQVISVETVAGAQELFRQIRDRADEMGVRVGWSPAVIAKPPPPHLSKGTKIASLEPRFRRGLIKYPRHLRHLEAFARLYRQTEYFTVDGKSLEHDDELDAVAMSTQYWTSPVPVVDAVYRPVSAVDLMASGELYLPGTRDPIAFTLPHTALNPAHIRYPRDEDVDEEGGNWVSAGV